MGLRNILMRCPSCDQATTWKTDDNINWSVVPEASGTDFYNILHAFNQTAANIEAIDLNTLVLRDGENLCCTIIFNDAGNFMRVFNHQAKKSLLPHQKRVVDEHAELAAKVNKLNNFFFAQAYRELDTAEKNRLLRQYEAMSDYLDILGERIEAFTAA